MDSDAPEKTQKDGIQSREQLIRRQRKAHLSFRQEGEGRKEGRGRREKQGGSKGGRREERPVKIKT